MKKYLKNIALLFISTGVISSCTNEFDKINIDPNNPAEPNTSLLISNSIRQIGNQTNGIAGWAKDIYPQYMSEIQYTNESRYQNKIYSFSPYYDGPLQDLQTVLNLNTSNETVGLPYVQAGGTTVNQVAVARILKSFYFLHMTDRWGMLPYSEALKGLGNITAKYDAQKDIYNSLFIELKEAATQLDESGNLNGDILFSGDVKKWKKWANSLRMIAALHLSEVDEATAKKEFVEALESGVLESNSDNVFFKYLKDANNQNPLYDNYFVGKRYDYAVSDVIVSFLMTIQDPRLPVYANKPTAGGDYVGMPYGLPGAVDEYTRETVSLIGDKFSAQDYALPITTYAQLEFMKAEAVFRGWIAGDVAAYYESGIRSSMEQHGVEVTTAYLQNTEVSLAGGDVLKKIITQKWLANYQANGYESWVDWRRTGFPVLTPGPAPLSIHKGIPNRQAYPNTEPGLNGKSYAEAIAAQGRDDLDTKLWWQPK